MSGRVDVIAETVDGHTELLRDLQDALVSHATDITEIRETLGGHAARMDSIEAKLDRHSAILDAHTATLDAHTATLDAHTATLDAHTAMLSDHGRRLTSHGDLLATILATVTRIEGRLAE